MIVESVQSQLTKNLCRSDCLLQRLPPPPFTLFHITFQCWIKFHPLTKKRGIHFKILKQIPYRKQQPKWKPNEIFIFKGSQSWVILWLTASYCNSKFVL